MLEGQQHKGFGNVDRTVFDVKTKLEQKGNERRKEKFPVRSPCKIKERYEESDWVRELVNF